MLAAFSWCELPAARRVEAAWPDRARAFTGVYIGRGVRYMAGAGMAVRCGYGAVWRRWR